MKELSIENKKLKLKLWLNDYIIKFEKNNSHSLVQEYKALSSAIEFSTSKTSIKSVNHLFEIRNKIQIHIDDNNFDKFYKKLNEKLIYNFNKLINKIVIIDFKTNNSNELYIIKIFKDDVDFLERNQLNINK